jgi:hypothetical protein
MAGVSQGPVPMIRLRCRMNAQAVLPPNISPLLPGSQLRQHAATSQGIAVKVVDESLCYLTEEDPT